MQTSASSTLSATSAAKATATTQAPAKNTQTPKPTVASELPKKEIHPLLKPLYDYLKFDGHCEELQLFLNNLDTKKVIKGGVQPIDSGTTVETIYREIFPSRARIKNSFETIVKLVKQSDNTQEIDELELLEGILDKAPYLNSVFDKGSNKKRYSLKSYKERLLLLMPDEQSEAMSYFELLNRYQNVFKRNILAIRDGETFLSGHPGVQVLEVNGIATYKFQPQGKRFLALVTDATREISEVKEKFEQHYQAPLNTGGLDVVEYALRLPYDPEVKIFIKKAKFYIRRVQIEHPREQFLKKTQHLKTINGFTALYLAEAAIGERDAFVEYTKDYTNMDPRKVKEGFKNLDTLLGTLPFLRRTRTVVAHIAKKWKNKDVTISVFQFQKPEDAVTKFFTTYIAKRKSLTPFEFLSSFPNLTFSEFNDVAGGKSLKQFCTEHPFLEYKATARKVKITSRNIDNLCESIFCESILCNSHTQTLDYEDFKKKFEERCGMSFSEAVKLMEGCTPEIYFKKNNPVVLSKDGKNISFLSVADLLIRLPGSDQGLTLDAADSMYRKKFPTAFYPKGTPPTETILLLPYKLGLRKNSIGQYMLIYQGKSPLMGLKKIVIKGVNAKSSHIKDKIRAHLYERKPKLFGFCKDNGGTFDELLDKIPFLTKDSKGKYLLTPKHRLLKRFIECTQMKPGERVSAFEFLRDFRDLCLEPFPQMNSESRAIERLVAHRLLKITPRKSLEETLVEVRSLKEKVEMIIKNESRSLTLGTFVKMYEKEFKIPFVEDAGLDPNSQLEEQLDHIPFIKYKPKGRIIQIQNIKNSLPSFLRQLTSLNMASFATDLKKLFSENSTIDPKEIERLTQHMPHIIEFFMKNSPVVKTDFDKMYKSFLDSKGVEIEWPQTKKFIEMLPFIYSFRAEDKSLVLALETLKPNFKKPHEIKPPAQEKAQAKGTRAITLSDYSFKHVPGDGHCFFHAVIAYIEKEYPDVYERVKDNIRGFASSSGKQIEMHEYLRAVTDYDSNTWVEIGATEEIVKVLRQLGDKFVITIMQKDKPEHGFTLAHADDGETTGALLSSYMTKAEINEHINENTKYIRLAFDGVHFEPVTAHTNLNRGLIRGRFNTEAMPPRNKDGGGGSKDDIDLDTDLSLDKEDPISGESLTLTKQLNQPAKDGQINLSDSFLIGKLPTTFNPNLVSLNLSRNLLRGALPQEIRTLVALEDLDLSENEFRGPIHVLSGLPKIRRLNLAHNQFSGTIPTRLLYKLENLILAYNYFSGHLEFPSKNKLGHRLTTVDLRGNPLLDHLPSHDKLTLHFPSIMRFEGMRVWTKPAAKATIQRFLMPHLTKLRKRKQKDQNRSHKLVMLRQKILESFGKNPFLNSYTINNLDKAWRQLKRLQKQHNEKIEKETDLTKHIDLHIEYAKVLANANPDYFKFAMQHLKKHLDDETLDASDKEKKKQAISDIIISTAEKRPERIPTLRQRLFELIPPDFQSGTDNDLYSTTTERLNKIEDQSDEEDELEPDVPAARAETNSPKRRPSPKHTKERLKRKINATRGLSPLGRSQELVNLANTYFRKGYLNLANETIDIITSEIKKRKSERNKKAFEEAKKSVEQVPPLVRSRFLEDLTSHYVLKGNINLAIRIAKLITIKTRKIRLLIRILKEKNNQLTKTNTLLQKYKDIEKQVQSALTSNQDPTKSAEATKADNVLPQDFSEISAQLLSRAPFDADTDVHELVSSIHVTANDLNDKNLAYLSSLLDLETFKQSDFKNGGGGSKEKSPISPQNYLKAFASECFSQLLIEADEEGNTNIWDKPNFETLANFAFIPTELEAIKKMYLSPNTGSESDNSSESEAESATEALQETKHKEKSPSPKSKQYPKAHGKEKFCNRCREFLIQQGQSRTQAHKLMWKLLLQEKHNISSLQADNTTLSNVGHVTIGNPAKDNSLGIIFKVTQDGDTPVYEFIAAVSHDQTVKAQSSTSYKVRLAKPGFDLKSGNRLVII